MKVICLTGGIASGKSSAARYLGEKGAHLIDADKLGHRAYEPDTAAFAQVVATFGDDIVDSDGQIDRKALGGKVFGQPDQLTRLTDIVWPEIRRLAELEISTTRKAEPDRIIVLEAAVLFEAGWQDIGDEIWTVTVAPPVAIERAVARDGIPAEAVQQRLDAQLSNEQRTGQSDVVIRNDGTQSEMQALLDAEWKRIGG